MIFMSAVEEAVKGLLQDLSKADRERIIGMLEYSGFNPNDPLFATMAAMGRIEALMNQVPDQLGTAVENWTVLIDEKLRLAASVSIAQQKEAIAKATLALIKKHGTSSVSSNSIEDVSSLATPTVKTAENIENAVSTKTFGIKILPVAILTGVALSMGAAIGLGISTVVASRYSDTSHLSAEDAKSLSWVKSSAGIEAQKLWERNESVIQTCKTNDFQKQLKGFCMLRVIEKN